MKSSSSPVALRTLGLLGGMSWESTAVYYRLLNEGVRDRLGGLHSAPLVLLSVDFAGIERLQHAGCWDEAGEVLADGARRLEAAGAECVVLCTNTMHKLADRIDAATRLPFIHIADATAAAVHRLGITTVGLLGTAFTMEQSFFRDRLADRHGLRVLVPDEARRREVHRVIYEELCVGRVEESSRAFLLETIADLVRAGAGAVLLCCTELMLLVRPGDAAVPVIDSTTEHARAAVEFALAPTAERPA
jgi:aspartate racemase